MKQTYLPHAIEKLMYGKNDYSAISFRTLLRLSVVIPK